MPIVGLDTDRSTQRLLIISILAAKRSAGASEKRPVEQFFGENRVEYPRPDHHSVGLGSDLTVTLHRLEILYFRTSIIAKFSLTMFCKLQALNLKISVLRRQWIRGRGSQKSWIMIRPIMQCALYLQKVFWRLDLCLLSARRCTLGSRCPRPLVTQKSVQFFWFKQKRKLWTENAENWFDWILSIDQNSQAVCVHREELKFGFLKMFLIWKSWKIFFSKCSQIRYSSISSSDSVLWFWTVRQPVPKVGEHFSSAKQKLRCEGWASGKATEKIRNRRAHLTNLSMTLALCARRGLVSAPFKLDRRACHKGWSLPDFFTFPSSSKTARLRINAKLCAKTQIKTKFFVSDFLPSPLANRLGSRSFGFDYA